MKTYGCVDAQLHAFLTYALNGDEVSASRSDRFTLEERALFVTRKNVNIKMQKRTAILTFTDNTAVMPILPVI
jgi:hypothetical protein